MSTQPKNGSIAFQPRARLLKLIGEELISDEVVALGELVAMFVAACVLLEYGVAASAVAVGWSGYFNELLQNTLGFQIPDAL